jgi:HK97 family phage major capsid protein
MSIELDTLKEMHTGVHGLIRKQKESDDKINAVESYLRQRKALAGSGSDFSPATADGNLLKMAAAQLFMKEGRTDAFELAGMTGTEKKLVLDTTKKAMDTGTSGAGGGFVIPPQWWASFIDVLRARLCVVRAGAVLMENLTGSPVLIPKQLTSGSINWIGQNASITPSDPSFGQIQFTPKTMALRAQYSNLLGMLSNPNMEGLIRTDFAKVCALELDRVSLRGSGASNQPLGLNGAAGLGTYAIGANGGNLSVDDLYNIVGVVEDANGLGDSLALITNPKALRKLKKQRIAQFSGDSGGSYITPPLLTDEALSKAIGLNCYTTTQLPVNLTKGSSSDCTEVYFGNWSDLLIAQWGAVEILATNIGGNAWSQNAIEVRLIFNCDIGVRHGASFVLCNDARTA